MAEAEGYAAPPSLLGGVSASGGNLVTLIEGSTFSISAGNGNMISGAPMGLFVRDTRILSAWVLEVDGERLEPLTASTPDPYRATYLTRARPRPGQVESTLLVIRERDVGEGMHERIRVRNLAGEAAGLTLTLLVGTDFADLFEVKEGRIRHSAPVVGRVDGEVLELSQDRRGRSRGVRVSVTRPGSSVTAVDAVCSASVEGETGRLTWHVAVPARAEWACLLDVEATIDGRRLEHVEHAGGAGHAAAERRAREWRETVPVIRTADSGLTRTLARSVADLGALRIFDPEHPDRAVVAAGAPWYMALFGRDSLLTSWMLLPLDARLALGTLRALADLQGVETDPLTEEQPGKILHEVRFGRQAAPTRGGGAHLSYGSVDATPLFVMLLGELRRWGLAREDVDALMPAADRALEWITERGDVDGDGFVEYVRATDRGMRNQGWKDSHDGISFADGTLAEPPIALCEVQGYAYSAFLARAHFARGHGDEDLAQHWAGRAAALKTAFNERFWLPDRGWFALGLDRDKRPIDALASNMGHCLWSGIVDEEKARAVASHLLSPDLFSGWGVRTLARSMARYNPISYHNGSVWPHDNAIIAAGLARYGFTTEAQIVAQSIFAAADRFDGRLPELFCGFDRSEFDDPVPYPTSCSPQAWAAAAPVLLLRSLLRLDPAIPAGEIRLSPVVPHAYLPLRMDRVAMAGSRISLEVTLDGMSLDGLPDGIAVVPEPRAPFTALVP